MSTRNSEKKSERDIKKEEKEFKEQAAFETYKELLTDTYNNEKQIKQVEKAYSHFKTRYQQESTNQPIINPDTKFEVNKELSTKASTSQATTEEQKETSVLIQELVEKTAKEETEAQTEIELETSDLFKELPSSKTNSSNTSRATTLIFNNQSDQIDHQLILYPQDTSKQENMAEKASEQIQKLVDNLKNLNKGQLKSFLEKQVTLLNTLETAIESDTPFKTTDAIDEDGLCTIVQTAVKELFQTVADGLKVEVDRIHKDTSEAVNTEQTNEQDDSNPKKINRLDANTPVFKRMGADVSIRDWIFKIENSMVLAKTPEDLKVKVAINYLKETAFNIARAYLDEKDGWSKLKEELLSVFTPFDEERKLKNQLSRLQQTTSFEAYLEKFHSLTYQLGTSKEVGLEYFLNGLKDNVRNQLLREKNSHTLADAIRNAAYICSSDQDYNQINSAVHKQRTHCTYCKITGHREADCRKKLQAQNGSHPNKAYNGNKFNSQQNNRSNQYKTNQKFNKPNQVSNSYKHENFQQNRQQQSANKAASVKDIVCYNCQKKGHKKSECRIHKQNLAMDVQSQVEKLYNEESTHFVNSALSKPELIPENKQANAKLKAQVRSFDQNILKESKTPSHTTESMQQGMHLNKLELINSVSEEPKIENFSRSKLYKLKGYINDIRATFIIDLGATGTIINRDFAYCHGLKIAKSDSLIMNADKHVTEVDGEVTCELSFKGSRKYKMKVMVMPQNDEWDILLGNDFMEIDKPSILIADRKIVFQDGTVVDFIKEGDDNEDSKSNYSVDKHINTDDEYPNDPLSIYSACVPDDPKLFDTDWGDADHSEENSNDTRKPTLFELYFKETGNFKEVPDGIYSTEEKCFMKKFRDVALLIPKKTLDKKNTKHRYVKIPENLSKQQEDRLFQTLAANYTSFADDLSDLANSHCGYSPFRILTDKVNPIYRAAFRTSKKEEEKMKDHIDELLLYKMIRPSRSPWSFPAFLVPKPNNKTRLVIDYRELNKITKSHPFPMPRIVDIFDQMVNSKYFSLIDLKAGFNQVVMHQNSVEKTAFMTPFGHFEWTVLPFGLKNAPSEFCRMMHSVLGNLPSVLVYLDDICVHTETIEQHFTVLEVVFTKLKEINLKINSHKVTFFADKIKILGHMVSHNQITLDTDKILKIRDRREPSNIKELQVFLGICNFYRRFIDNFADITKPLTELLKKEVKFEWTTICQERFNLLKHKLCHYPILRLPDLSRAFILYTDASQFAAGARSYFSQLVHENKGTSRSTSQVGRSNSNLRFHYWLQKRIETFERRHTVTSSTTSYQRQYKVNRQGHFPKRTLNVFRLIWCAPK